MAISTMPQNIYEPNAKRSMHLENVVINSDRTGCRYNAKRLKIVFPPFRPDS